MKKIKTLSIVVPVYNEKNLVIDVLKKVNKLELQNINKEIIVVDDCSNDGTTDILKKDGQKYCHKIIYHQKNTGKGGALRSGFECTTGDVVIIQDSDFEYDITDIPKVVLPIFNDECDVCYGSRFLNQKAKGYKSNQLANKVLTSVSNLMTGNKVTDMETCYKAFRGDIIRSINIVENRFGFEPEITAKISKMGYKIYEVPISYNPRTKEEGKKIKYKDGFRALYCIAKYKFGKSDNLNHNKKKVKK